MNGNDSFVDIKKPCLIILHGGPGLADHSLYVPFWSKLKDNIQVIFIDMRGHGQSSGHNTPESWNLAQWGKDLYDFCSVCNIEKPIIAGISFGGWVAQAYATQFPNHLKALILCHTEAQVDIAIRKNAYRRKAEVQGLNGNEIADIIQQLKDHPNDKSTSTLYLSRCIPLYSTNPYKPEDFAKCIRNQAVWDHFHQQQYKFNFLPVLQKINCPTLIITGELDPEHPPEFAEIMAKKIKKSTLVIMDNTGVPIYKEKEQETLEILKEYINNIKF